MAFPTGSTSSKITIDHTKVAGSSNLSNFPTLISGVNIPDGVWAAMQGDGDDIRFTTDALGTTQIAFEIVVLNKALKIAEIWVKIPTVNHGSATEIHMWFGDPTLSAYAVTDTYGRNAVWSDYVGVWHLQANSNDSGAGGRNGTDSNISYTDDGLIENSAELNGSNAVISLADNAAYDVSNLTVQMMIRPDTPAGSTQGLFSHYFESGATRYGLRFFLSGGKLRMGVHDGSTATYAYSVGATTLTDNAAVIVHGRYDHTAIKVFLDGVEDGTIAYTNNFNWTSCASPRIGVENYTGSNTAWFDGGIDEVRYRGSALTSDWMLTEKEMFKNPSTFLTMEDISQAGGGFLLNFM